MKIEQKAVRLSVNSKGISSYIKDGWRVLIARIKHITSTENYPYGLMPGYVILGLEIC